MPRSPLIEMLSSLTIALVTLSSPIPASASGQLTASDELGGLIDALYASPRPDAALQSLVDRGDDGSIVALLDVLPWALANETGEYAALEALAQVDDARVSDRVFEILSDASRSDALRLRAARTTLRIGSSIQVERAHAFLTTLYSASWERRRGFDEWELIRTLGESGPTGQQLLREWLLGGTGYFADALHIARALFADLTPEALDTLSTFAESLGDEPWVQLELLEHLLARAEDLDLARAHAIAASMAVSDHEATRHAALVWRLKQRLRGRLDGDATIPDRLERGTETWESTVLRVMDRLLQEHLELEGWKIPELFPPDLQTFRERASSQPGLAQRWLRTGPPEIEDLLADCAERLRFAPDVRDRLLSTLSAPRVPESQDSVPSVRR